MKIVAFVPIRLNSKRVVGKNLKLLGGKPLLTYIFTSLKMVKGIDEIYAFCSSEEIKQWLPDEVYFLKRDIGLDRDETLGYEIYQSFCRSIIADIYILAHTTSPFVEPASIQNALENVLKGNFDSAFSVRRQQTFTWYKGTPLNYSLDSIPRTQDLEPVFTETSAFFIFNKETWFRKHRRIGLNPFMQELGIVEGIDIDNNEDFEFAEKFV
jgi:CMP-N-acetylneuraminic acid synthetase